MAKAFTLKTPGDDALEVEVIGEDAILFTACDRWGGDDDGEPCAVYATVMLSKGQVAQLAAFLTGRPQPWNKQADQEALCTCGHPYYRHFDSYDDMEPIGCKYCRCLTFTPAEKGAS